MRSHAGERGSVTAEMAVALPVVVLLVATVAGAGTLGRAHVQCRDAAWTAARLLARGDSLEEARTAAARTAPAGAELAASTGTQPGTVTVTVRARVPILLSQRAELPLDCRATAPLERGLAGRDGDA